MIEPSDEEVRAVARRQAERWRGVLDRLAQYDQEGSVKIYIAGPMTGLPESNFPAFALAAEQLTAAGFTVLNPADHGTDTSKPWHHYIRLGLRMLLDADAVATLPGWEVSRGATLEVHTAHALAMPVMPIGEWLV